MMRKATCLLLFAILLGGCHRQSVKQPQTVQTDTVPMMVMQIQKCAKLYTQEYQLHKIVMYDDTAAVTGKILGRSFKVDLPLGNRKIAIPMTATAAAYIDFSHFSRANVKHNGRKLEIVLPDPVITLTATRIDHNQVKEKVSLLRTRFSDAERSRVEQQGRSAMVKALGQMDLVESARLSAVQQLMPMLRQMGFRDDDVTITFRKNLGNSPIEHLIKIKN